MTKEDLENLIVKKRREMVNAKVNKCKSQRELDVAKRIFDVWDKYQEVETESKKLFILLALVTTLLFLQVMPLIACVTPIISLILYKPLIQYRCEDEWVSYVEELNRIGIIDELTEEEVEKLLAEKEENFQKASDLLTKIELEISKYESELSRNVEVLGTMDLCGNIDKVGGIVEFTIIEEEKPLTRNRKKKINNNKNRESH